MSRPFIVGNSLKVTTMAFSQLFSDMKVFNYDENGKPILEIPVNVSLDTKESIYEYLKYGGSHKKIDQKDTILPRIGIQITNIIPALDRQSGKGENRLLYRQYDSNEFGKRFITDVKKDIQPVPMDITYTVSIWCKYIDHWAQITENILPHFNPYTTVGVKERDLGIERHIHVRLDSVSPNNSFEVGQGNSQRIIRSEMEFTCQTILYKYMSKDTSGIVDNIWLWTIDLDTPFASSTMNISAGPTSVLPLTAAPSTSGDEG